MQQKVTNALKVLSLTAATLPSLDSSATLASDVLSGNSLPTTPAQSVENSVRGNPNASQQAGKLYYSSLEKVQAQIGKQIDAIQKKSESIDWKNEKQVRGIFVEIDKIENDSLQKMKTLAGRHFAISSQRDGIALSEQSGQRLSELRTFLKGNLDYGNSKVDQAWKGAVDTAQNISSIATLGKIEAPLTAPFTAGSQSAPTSYLMGGLATLAGAAVVVGAAIKGITSLFRRSEEALAQREEEKQDKFYTAKERKEILDSLPKVQATPYNLETLPYLTSEQAAHVLAAIPDILNTHALVHRSEWNWKNEQKVCSGLQFLPLEAKIYETYLNSVTTVAEINKRHNKSVSYRRCEGAPPFKIIGNCESSIERLYNLTVERREQDDPGVRGALTEKINAIKVRFPERNAKADKEMREAIGELKLYQDRHFYAAAVDYINGACTWTSITLGNLKAVAKEHDKENLTVIARKLRSGDYYGEQANQVAFIPKELTEAVTALFALDKKSQGIVGLTVRHDKDCFHHRYYDYNGWIGNDVLKMFEEVRGQSSHRTSRVMPPVVYKYHYVTLRDPNPRQDRGLRSWFRGKTEAAV